MNEFKLRLLEADELTPLKVWQLQDLSFQAGQRVVSAPKSDALQQLQDLSQNFPMVARALTRTVVKSEFRQEVEANQAVSRIFVFFGLCYPKLPFLENVRRSRLATRRRCSFH